MNSITHSSQKGVALIGSLIVLVILTLIGVTAMNTSTLEEKMAVNMQENFSAFNAAETGVNQAFVDTSSIDLDNPTTLPTIVINNTKADVTTTYRENTKPPKKTDALYSASQFQAAHFDVVSTGQAGAFAETVVRAGMYQILPGGFSQ